MWITDWTTRAACKGTDPDELFVQGAAQNRAKLICRGCPVRTECLADALDNGIEFGVWGGMTERERRALLRRRPEVTSWRDLLERARDEYERADMGIIMVRFVRLRFAAVAMIAAAIIAATTASGWAFSQQTISPDANGNYNFNYTDPNHPATTSQSAHPSESNSLGFHFSVEHGQTGPFGGFQSGNNSFGHSGNDRPPELTPLGNNGN